MSDAAEMHRYCLIDWPTDSGLFLHRMQYLHVRSRKQMTESMQTEKESEGTSASATSGQNVRVTGGGEL